ncbi:MAG: TrmH family RNA methyltransferase, partial [Sphaerochaetaceae bacterium]
ELGVSPKLLKAADESKGRVTIPLYGTKGSLNVSVAFGILIASWHAQVHVKR